MAEYLSEEELSGFEQAVKSLRVMAVVRRQNGEDRVPVALEFGFADKLEAMIQEIRQLRADTARRRRIDDGQG